MSDYTAQTRDATVVELLDRLLDHGVVLSGDIRVSVADVELIEIGLRLLIRTPVLHETSTRYRSEQSLQEGSDDLALRLRPASDRD